MTKKSRSALIAQANTTLPDNNSMEISPSDVRNMAKDIADSFVSNSGDTGVSGVIRYSAEHSLGDRKDIVYLGYVDDAIAGITIPVISDDAYNATSWDGDPDGASKNSLRDKFVLVDAAQATSFTNAGNNFGSDAILGLTSNHNLSIYTNNAERIKITSTGLVAVAQKLLVGDTDTSLLSTRDFVVAGSGNTSASDCATFYNSDFGSPLLRIKNDGNLVLSTGLQDSGGVSIVDIPNREYTDNTGTTVLGLNAKLLVGAWGCNNNFRLTNNTSAYIWGMGVDEGDYRTRISGSNLITERFEGGSWVTKNTILG